MYIREYASALWEDWVALMSGAASIGLAFWAAYFPPQNVQAGRTLLFLCAAACFIISSYRIWRNEHEHTLALKEELKPKVSIAFFNDRPSFIAIKAIRGKDYRVLRVRIKNDGGDPLYSLRAQLKLFSQHYSYEDIDLTLKEEGLPIIQHHLIRRDTGVLPKPRTSFELSRGGEQFISVAMQENVDGKWSQVELCLSQIGADNYSNAINVEKPIEFSIIVLGGIYPSYSKSFVLFLDKEGVLQMKQAD